MVIAMSTRDIKGDVGDYQKIVAKKLQWTVVKMKGVVARQIKY